MTPTADSQGTPLDRHVEEGPIERVQEEPIGFRVLPYTDVVVPIYVYGHKVFETWVENGQKYGRWTWRYV